MSIGTPKASWLTAIVLPGAPGSKHVSCAYASSACCSSASGAASWAWL